MDKVRDVLYLCLKFIPKGNADSEHLVFTSYESTLTEEICSPFSRASAIAHATANFIANASQPKSITCRLWELSMSNEYVFLFSIKEWAN